MFFQLVSLVAINVLEFAFLMYLKTKQQHATIIWNRVIKIQFLKKKVLIQM